MRLVDTDRFAVVSSHIIPEVIEDTWEEGYCACLDIIDAMPTIEAIPIEFIEDTRKLAERVQHSKYANYLKILLEDWKWEKEKWLRENHH